MYPKKFYLTTLNGAAKRLFNLTEVEHRLDSPVMITGYLEDPADLFALTKCDSKIDRVIFNAPATIVIWSDGSKTVVKCQPGDEYNKETGLAMCIAKKYLGNKGNFNETFKKYIEGYDPREK